MAGNLFFTAKQSAIYGVGNLAVKLTGFLLLPLYTTNLSLAEFGVLGILEVTGQILVSAVSVRLPNAFLRWAADGDEIEHRRGLYSTVFWLLLSICLLFLLVIWAAAPALSALLFDTPGSAHYLYILAGSIVFEIIGLLALQALRTQQKSGSFLFVTIIKFSVLLGTTFYFLSVREMGIEGVLYGMLCGNLALCAATLPAQLAHVRLEFNRRDAAQMLSYGGPLIVSSVSYLLLSMGDRYLLKALGSFEAVGIYTLAFKLGSVVNVFIVNSFNLGFLPIAFKTARNPDFLNFLSRTGKWFLFALAGGSLFVALFSQEVIKLITASNTDYWSAIYLVPFIAMCFLLKGVQYIQTVLFHVHKRTRFDAWVVSLTVMLSLHLNYFLIPYYGAEGSVMAMFISSIFMVGITQFYVRKIAPFQVFNREYLTLFLVAAAFLIATYFTFHLDFFIRLFTKSGLLLAFIPVLWLMHFFVAADRDACAVISATLRSRTSGFLSGWGK